MSPYCSSGGSLGFFCNLSGFTFQIASFQAFSDLSSHWLLFRIYVRVYHLLGRRSSRSVMWSASHGLPDAFRVHGYMSSYRGKSEDFLHGRAAMVIGECSECQQILIWTKSAVLRYPTSSPSVENDSQQMPSLCPGTDIFLGLTPMLWCSLWTGSNSKNWALALSYHPVRLQQLFHGTFGSYVHVDEFPS